jgi:hypothetical protein
MRLLSVGLWYHFAYMVISLALLGFGAAGSFLFIGFERMEKHFDQWLLLLAGATAVAFPMAFALSQEIGLDPLQLIWQKNEWGKMLISYLLMGLPFFLAGGIVGMILTAAGDKAHLMYGADLMGAGCGALVFRLVWYLGSSARLAGVVLIRTLGCCRGMPHPWRGISWILVCFALSMAAYVTLPPIPRMHHTKPLPVTLAFPDARVEAEKNGPLGMLHVVGSSLIREAPGLSLNFGLQANFKSFSRTSSFSWTGCPCPIIRSKRTGGPEYLDFTSRRLYHIRHPLPRSSWFGGGTDVLLGLRQGVPITAWKPTSRLQTFCWALSEFSGICMGERVVESAGGSSSSIPAPFDLISLLLDSFGSSAGRLHSEALATTEAFGLPVG